MNWVAIKGPRGFGIVNRTLVDFITTGRWIKETLEWCQSLCAPETEKGQLGYPDPLEALQFIECPHY